MNDRLYMDAVISSNASLGPRGRAWLIGGFAGLELAAGVLLLVIKAGAVLPFLLIPVGALAAALYAGRQCSQAAERIRVDAVHVRVSRIEKDGERTTWLSPTAFTRVEFADESFGAGELKLKISARETTVARDLSRPERRVLADRLEWAIQRARSGRV